MKRRIGLVTVGVVVFLTAALASGTACLGGDSDPKGKEIVGTWQGTFSMQSGNINVEMILREEGKNISGELKTPHGPWTVTEAKFSEGKWEILIRTPENGTGQLKGAISGDKFEGSYLFPPSFGGEFKLTRAKQGK